MYSVQPQLTLALCTIVSLPVFNPANAAISCKGVEAIREVLAQLTPLVLTKVVVLMAGGLAQLVPAKPITVRAYCKFIMMIGLPQVLNSIGTSMPGR